MYQILITPIFNLKFCEDGHVIEIIFTKFYRKNHPFNSRIKPHLKCTIGLKK